MKVLRTAVVGLGRIGWRYHIPQIKANPNFSLEAVIDPLPERLEEAKTAFGVPRVYTDYDAFLKDGNCDLVVIASPTRFHAPQTIAALEHGLDVFCDKPMAFNLDEADMMIAAARRTGRKLMVYQPHRVTPQRLTAGVILERGILGDLYMIKNSLCGYVRRNDWQAWRKNGGGMLYNYGAHAIDQALDIARSTTRNVDCTLRTIAAMGDADDTVKAVIETESGIIIDVDICMGAALPLPNLILLGTRGAAVLDAGANAWRVRYFEQGALRDKGMEDALAANGRSYPSDLDIPWKEETVSLDSAPGASADKIADTLYYRKAYEYFGENKTPFVPMEESRELMRTLELCLASATQKRR